MGKQFKGSGSRLITSYAGWSKKKRTKKLRDHTENESEKCSCENCSHARDSKPLEWQELLFSRYKNVLEKLAKGDKGGSH